MGWRLLMQVIAFSFAVIFFALMRQSQSWDLDVPIPSLLEALQSNLRMPLPALLLIMVPIVISFLLSLLMDGSLPSPGFVVVSTICYFLANGFVIILISISQMLFYLAAFMLVFIKTRFVSHPVIFWVTLYWTVTMLQKSARFLCLYCFLRKYSTKLLIRLPKFASGHFGLQKKALHIYVMTDLCWSRWWALML